MTENQDGIRVQEIVACAIDIGAQMMLCGGEVHRVEDTITRIVRICDVDEINVFASTYLIVVTVSADGEELTKSRRIHNISYRLDVVAACNQLSRDICSERMQPEKIRKKISEIRKMHGYGKGIMLAGYAMIGSAFCVFFGGGFFDLILAAVVACTIRLTEVYLKKLTVNRFVVLSLCSAAAAVVARLGMWLYPGFHIQAVCMGNIMILISGLTFTNAIRDMFMDNFLSGGLRFVEAIFVAMAISFGFWVAGMSFY